MGMERADVAAMFSAYFNRETHTVEQIRFVELVIDELTRNGAMDPGRLYEKPFSDIAYEGPEEIFDDRTLDGLIDLTAEVRRRALPSDGPLPGAPVGAA